MRGRDLRKLRRQAERAKWPAEWQDVPVEASPEEIERSDEAWRDAIAEQVTEEIERRFRP